MTSIESQTPPRIDWGALRKRLEASILSCERETIVSPQRSREILLERARRAATPSAVMETGAAMEIVEFALGGEAYGVETRFVREIAPLRGCVPVPGAPPFVIGVFSLRGSIVSLIDLRRVFGLSPTDPDAPGRAIVLRHPDGMEFALFANSVAGVRRVAHASVQPPLATQTGRRADFCFGVLGDSLTILHAEWILADKTLCPRDATDRTPTTDSPKPEGAQTK